jgi:hypothetical protein
LGLVVESTLLELWFIRRDFVPKNEKINEIKRSRVRSPPYLGQPLKNVILKIFLPKNGEKRDDFDSNDSIKGEKSS